jgi:hypothetical protein
VNQTELERSILGARDRGDQPMLQRLQAEYRRAASVVRITREPVRIVERSKPRQRSAVTTSSNGTKARVEPVPTLVRIRPDAWTGIENVSFEQFREIGAWLVGVSNDLEIVVCGVWQNATGEEPYAGDRDSVHMDGELAAVIDEHVAPAGHKSCNGRRGNKPLHEMTLPLTYRPPRTRAPRSSRPLVYARWG